MSEAQSPEDRKRQYPPQPQLVHPAAFWQKIQKYLLLYHQTTEQLLPSDCEIPPNFVKMAGSPWHRQGKNARHQKDRQHHFTKPVMPTLSLCGTVLIEPDNRDRDS